MAEIYDFDKYLTAKEIDMYETRDKTKLCIACPECLNQEFAIYLDNTIQCVDCELTIQLEFEE